MEKNKSKIICHDPSWEESRDETRKTQKKIKENVSLKSS